MIKLKFIEPMYARAVEKLPEGRDWLYEIKLDGYRALAGRDSSRVTLWSRRGNLFTAQFPRVARAFEKLEANTLIDGEIVAVDDDGPDLIQSTATSPVKGTRSSVLRV